MLVNMIMNRGYLTKIRCYRSSSPFSSSSFSLLRSSSPSSSSSVSVRPTAKIYYRYQSYYQSSTSVSDRSSEAKAVKSSSKMKEVLVYTGTTIDEYNNDNNNYSLVTYSIISTCVMIIIHYIFIYIYLGLFSKKMRWLRRISLGSTCLSIIFFVSIITKLSMNIIIHFLIAYITYMTCT